jgi:putative DNA methylase
MEELYHVAEMESWRKEIMRPIYHVHKWWATRLGSVFRAILISALTEDTKRVWDLFYKKNDFGDVIVLDPLMGSGTTLGEALKIGCRVVGCDINPVSYFIVRTMLKPVKVEDLEEAYSRLEKNVKPKITRYYKSRYDGYEADVLYVFWVKLIECPNCHKQSRLFNDYVFSSHAYPSKNPLARCVCPSCGEIMECHINEKRVICSSCGNRFNPHHGPAKRTTFVCENCGKEHNILESYRASSLPPEHQMFALMLLLPDGRKVYKRPDDSDHALYAEAVSNLSECEGEYPTDPILPGYNADQARAYNYLYWYQLFNGRQLYCLTTLFKEIIKEPNDTVRDNLLLLFSGCLEYNNMFCSFKGEGTGAVRPIYYHHILKPEREPLENNVWGTEKSSGSFSTMFRRRLIRAREYCSNPFEIRVVSKGGKARTEKVFGINNPLNVRLANSFEDIIAKKADAFIITGSSTSLPLPDGRVNLVVTDPPFFNNVHYSELADFFYCWLRKALYNEDPAFNKATTRDPEEIQGTDVDRFSSSLTKVFKECRRVLSPDGRLIFTFHHSTIEAWVAILRAILDSGFEVVNAFPVKAEMSVAVPKTQEKEPINMDAVIVCKPRTEEARRPVFSIKHIEQDSRKIIQRYNRSGIYLSKGDIKITVMSQLVKHYGAWQPYATEDERSKHNLSDLLEICRGLAEKLFSS